MNKTIRILFLFLYLFHFSLLFAQTTTDKKENNPDKYFSAVKTGPMLGISDGGTLLGAGGYFYLRSYKPLSLIPAAGFTFLQYIGESSESNNIALEASVAANLQYYRIIHFRVTGYAGIIPLINENKIFSFYQAATVGTGLSLWRLEADFDIGYIFSFSSGGYIMPRLSLGYVFIKTIKLVP